MWVIEGTKYCEKQCLVNCMPLAACMPMMVTLLMPMVGKQQGDKGDEDDEDEDNEVEDDDQHADDEHEEGR